MSRFKLLYFVIFVINLCIINAQISDKRLCVDEECKVPISLAKTLLRYSSPDSRILSFAPNVDITIYSKSAGSREDLWGGEINGKRGYVPKHLVRETRVLQKPTILVDTEFANETAAQQVPSQVEPAKVQEPYEVVDGTTIYLTPQEDISPSSTESPIQTTALPNDESKVASNEQNENKEEKPPEETSNQSNDQPAENKIEEATPPPQEEKKAANQETEPAKEEPKVEGPELKKEEEEDDADIEEDDDEDDDEDDEGSEELEAVIEETDNKDVVEEVNTPPELNKSQEPKEEIKLDVLNETATVAEEVEKVAPVTETPSVNQVPESSPITQQEEAPKIQDTEEVKSEEIPPKIEESKEQREATTLNPEFEVPQPFIDGFADVTPNPVETVTEEVKVVEEEVKVAVEEDKVAEEEVKEAAQEVKLKEEEVKVVSENVVPTLPPLGLFGNQNFNNPPSENSQPMEEEKKESVEEVKQPPEEIVSKENDISFTEDTKEVVSEEVEVQKEETEAQKESTEEMNDREEEIDVQNEVVEPQKEATDENKEVEDKEAVIKEKNEELEGKKEELEDKKQELEEGQSGGLFSGIFSMFSSTDEEKPELTSTHDEDSMNKHVEEDELISVTNREQTCDATSCEEKKIEESTMDLFTVNTDFLLYLVTTAISVIIFLFGYIAFDKSKREGPLIARINTLEKELLILVKENQILQENAAGESGYDTNDRIPNEVVQNLKQELYDATLKKNQLEEQVQLLEKELENSTEVGMELNKMLSDILSSESGSDVLKANVEHLQRQLVEQQATINSVNETLAMTNTENHELRLELEISNKKVLDLQTELDKLLLNVLKIEEEKDTQQNTLENEITTYRQKCEEISAKLRLKEEEFNVEVKQLRNKLDHTERNLELKLKEHDILTDTIKQLKAMKSNDGPSLQALLDSSSLKAEVQQLKSENQRFRDRLQQEEEAKTSYEKKAEFAVEEARFYKEKYDEVDKLRVETETKLEVLSNYFKDREAQLQKEISKHESLWEEKQGEASSTTERIKFMQEQLQNYKAQTESLKQEIVSQEVELKSQISVLEKKAHENWVSARQAERKLEEAKQEASQLRHRLTLRERAIQEDKNRFQSPIEQNGDMLSSPIESPASPPLLYGGRDHITKSPPIPGLPPFLPPPPGVPFMPPPLPGVPPFIPPPTMFPGDHRPPPLGRMSSPPLNSRYSPSSRGYSPYDRNSSSPSDSEYGTSPPQRRGYSPFNSREDPRRPARPNRPPPGRTNGRSMIKGGGSSGSGHSNESLDKVNRQQSKV